MVRRNLLLCFDAFGTLFVPRGSVAQQYAQVARQCGLATFSDDELESRLTSAIRQERKLNPNYGKATGLGAKGWWTKVIYNTFTPLLENNQKIPPTLVPALIHRFASDQGYQAQPDLVPALRALRRPGALLGFDEVVIGVVTNSDDRVPRILASFGLDVSPLRYGTAVKEEEDKAEDTRPLRPGPGHRYDIDFHCMSYDVGFEKPDRRIFEAAESMVSRVMAGRTGQTQTAVAAEELSSWYKVYVGDDEAKDVVGSAKAGWHPIFVVDGRSEKAEIQMASLEDCRRECLADVLEEYGVVQVSSIGRMALWLAGPRACSQSVSS